MRSSASRHEAAFAVALCAMLAGYNNILGLLGWHRRWYTVVNVCATAAVLSAAGASGLPAAELGLGRDRLRTGLRLGSRLAAAAAGGWLLVAVLPVTRSALRDERIMPLSGREIVFQVTVRIPVGTALWEEVAFRGVLQAALRRVIPAPAAIAVTSGLFGIWHIRPTMEAVRINRLAGNRRKAVTAVTTAVAGTAAGGMLLSILRARSGSLAPPVLLHAATNCAGALAVWCATRGAAAPRLDQRREVAARSSI